MSRAIVTIRRSKDRPRLGPAGAQRRITTSIPGEKTQTVLRSPAVAGRVGKVRLAAIVHRRSTFHDRGTVPLPAFSGRGENLGSADLAGRSERCDAERLELVRHARPDEVVTPFAEAEDAAVDAPDVG